MHHWARRQVSPTSLAFGESSSWPFLGKNIFWYHYRATRFTTWRFVGFSRKRPFWAPFRSEKRVHFFFSGLRPEKGGAQNLHPPKVVFWLKKCEKFRIRHPKIFISIFFYRASLWYSGRNPGSAPGGVGPPCRPADPRRPCYFWDFFDPKWAKPRFFGGQKMAPKWPKNGQKSHGGAPKNPK